MTTSSGGFELHGTDTDETRLLVHSELGYAIALPGYPRVAGPASGTPAYDVVVQLEAAPIELGFRMDAVASEIPARTLVPALVLAYAQSRATEPGHVSVQALQGRTLAIGATRGAAHAANYQLRDVDTAAMEYLAVTGKQGEGVVHALHMTVRYRRGETSPFGWANLRSALLAHQSWTPGALPSTTIWPTTCAFVAPSVKFELMDAAFEVARAKSAAITAMPQEDVSALADLLLEMTNDDSPPAMPWPPIATDHLARRVTSCIPTQVADVLLLNAGEIQSMHDFRGWAWQCYWAVGNRTALQTKFN